MKNVEKPIYQTVASPGKTLFNLLNFLVGKLPLICNFFLVIFSCTKKMILHKGLKYARSKFDQYWQSVKPNMEWI